MKKSIILLSICALPVLAGDPAPVIAPAPAPCPLTLEVAAVYNDANHATISNFPGIEDINTWGADLTANYALNSKHSVNLRLGYTFGDEVSRYPFEQIELDQHTFYLMPGYRYTHALTEKVALFAGVNAGIANVSTKACVDAADARFKNHDSDWGFAYSLEAGVRYQLSPKMEVFAAYSFNGSTAQPELGETEYNKQTYHGVRTGVSFSF